MKRKFLCAVLALLLACSFVLPLPAYADISYLSVSAKSAVLIDASDGRVIYEKNARERMGMASTTKIMTALLVAEDLSPEKIISIPKEAVNTEGSSVYLTEGEMLSVKELLYALLLSSANDAAVALAIAHSGSIDAFAERMNEKAESLGLCDTHFTNPHGLYDENHYTTAMDLALLSAKALENDLVREISAKKKVTVSHGVTKDNPNGDGTKRYLQNHNKMLRLYDGAIGLKTGFTKKTGRCLVSAAERDGLRLVAVTLCAPNDWQDHTAMLDYGYSRFSRVTLFPAGEFTYSFPLTGGYESYVTLTNAEEIALTLPRDYKEPTYTVTSTRHFEFAPVAKSTQLATLVIDVDGKRIYAPLYTAYEARAVGKHNK